MACQPDSSVGVHVGDVIVKVLGAWPNVNILRSNGARKKETRKKKKQKNGGNVRCQRWRIHFRTQASLPNTSDRIYSHRHNNRKPGSMKSRLAHNSTRIGDCPSPHRSAIHLALSLSLYHLFRLEFAAHVKFIILRSRSTRPQNASRSALDRYDNRLVLLICKLNPSPTLSESSNGCIS